MKTSEVALGFLALPEGGRSPGRGDDPRRLGPLGPHARLRRRGSPNEGFAVLAIDLYRRARPDEDRGPGRVDARALGSAGARRSAARARASSPALPETNGRVGVLGFCMGGMYALMAGCADLGFSAAVPFYGLLSHAPRHPARPGRARPREEAARAARDGRRAALPAARVLRRPGHVHPARPTCGARARARARARGRGDRRGAGRGPRVHERHAPRGVPARGRRGWRGGARSSSCARTLADLVRLTTGESVERARVPPPYTGRASTSASVRSRVAKRVTLQVTAISRPRLSTSADSKRRGSAPSVIASSSVHHEAWRCVTERTPSRRRRAARRARRRAARPRRDSRRRSGPSSRRARGSHRPRGRSRRRPRAASRAARLSRAGRPVDWRSRATNACWSGRSAVSIASPCGAPAAAAASIQPSSSAAARRSCTRRPSSAGSAGRPLASAAAAQLRKRRKQLGLGARGIGRGAAELRVHEGVDPGAVLDQERREVRSGHGAILPGACAAPQPSRAKCRCKQGMETAAEKHVLISHAGPEAYAPMTRVILAKLGYLILLPEEIASIERPRGHAPARAPARRAPVRRDPR